MPLIACNQCGQQLDRQVRVCPDCGAPRTASPWIKLGTLALIAATLASAAYAIAHNRRAASGIASNIPIDDTREPANQMRDVAEQYVKRALQAPATAQFAPPAEWQTTPIDKSTSCMHAWVDSDNADAKTLRAFFTIAIRLHKETASLLYLQFDDDEKPFFGAKPLTAEEKKLQLDKKQPD